METQSSTHRRILLVGLIVVLLLVIIILVPPGIQQPPITPSSPSVTVTTTSSTNSPTASIPDEYPVTVIPLAGLAAGKNVEISGMAWYKDTLILLPQFPERFGNGGEGAVFGLTKASILVFLNGQSTESLTPFEIPLVTSQLKTAIDGYEGFESIAFLGDKVYFTIEASPDGMMGYLVSGSIATDLSEIRLDLSTLISNPPQVNIPNYSDEAILVTYKDIITFFEANGKGLNPHPVAHTFDLSGGLQGTIDIPNLEYRLTDVTPIINGSFWAINYFFPGDEAKLKLVPDTLAIQFGKGPTHSQYSTVERLVEFSYDGESIILADTPPIQLQLIDDDHSRNWEAIALLDERGFLLASDKFPETILGFVSYP